MSDAAIDTLCATINKGLDGGALVHSVKAAITTSVVTKEGRWKTQNVGTDVELQFTGVRAGKRSQVLFVFEPVDDRPFTKVEIDEKKIAEAIPEVVDQVVRLIGGDGGDFLSAKRAFIKSVRSEDAVKADKEKAAADAKYTSNPLWGTF